MKIKVIKTDDEYQEALAELSKLMDKGASRRVEEIQELELLMLVIQDYEQKIAEPIGDLDPIEAIKFRMEQQPMSQKDLVPYIGSSSKVSEVLSGKRKLSRKMIQNLHQGLGIPLESLYRESSKPKRIAIQQKQELKVHLRAQRVKARKLKSRLSRNKVARRKIRSRLFTKG